jgi:hypothetical protein
MIFHAIANGLRRGRARFEAYAAGRSAWITGAWVGLSAWVLSMFMYFTPLFYYPDMRTRWDAFLAMCANPVARDLSHPILYYRVTTPVIAWLLHLPGVTPIAIQYIAMVATLVLIYVAMARRTTAMMALATTIGLSLTFLTQWVNVFPTYPDSVTHAAVVLCLLYPRAGLAFALTVAGTMNDERFVVAIPFILFWHLGWTGWRAGLIRHGRFLLGLGLGLVVVLILRHALAVGWIGPGIATPETYVKIKTDSILAFQPYGSTWPKFAVSAFMGFRWIWLVPLAFLATRIPGAHPFAKPAYGLLLFAGALSCAVVLDVSRSIGFLFPAVLVAATELYRQRAEWTVRLHGWVIALLLVTPTCIFIGQWPYCFWPPLYQLLRHAMKTAGL